MKVEKKVVEKFLNIAKKSLDYDEMCHCDVCEELNKVEECLDELIRLAEIGRCTEIAFKIGLFMANSIEPMFSSTNNLIEWGKKQEGDNIE